MNRGAIVRALALGAATVIVLALCASIAFRVYAAHRLSIASENFEKAAGPLDPALLRHPEVPKEENAATWIGAGMSAIVLLDGDQGKVATLAKTPFQQWSFEEASKLDAILRRNQPALELLDRARGRTRSTWNIDYVEGDSAKLPELAAAMSAAKLLTARARLALGRGDEMTVIASAEALGVMARSFEGEPSLMMVLVGTAVERYQLAAIHELVSSDVLVAADLDRLASSLATEEPAIALRRALHTEAAWMVRELHSDRTMGERPFFLPRAVAIAIADLSAAHALHAHLLAGRLIGQPVTAPIPAVDPEVKTVGWWSQLASLFGPETAGSAARMTATNSARQLARLAIALRREAIRAGRYPAGVPVVSGVAEADPLTGGPRIYTLLPDGSAEIRSTTTDAILRSIVPNGLLTVENQYRWPLPAPSRRN